MYQAFRGITRSLFHYAPEPCAWCRGLGLVDGCCCPACSGPGHVLASQPGLQCSACYGTGRAPGRSYSMIAARCVACAGSGWLTRNQG